MEAHGSVLVSVGVQFILPKNSQRPSNDHIARGVSVVVETNPSVARSISKGRNGNFAGSSTTSENKSPQRKKSLLIRMPPRQKRRDKREAE